jgi:hypothetical protein
LDYEVNEGESTIIIVQFKYKKFIKSFLKGMSLNSNVNIKIYSSYQFWNNTKVMNLIGSKRRKIVKIEKAEIWVGIMPGVSLLTLAPYPERVGILLSQHPGYSKKDIETSHYTGMLWISKNILLDKNPFEIYLEYTRTMIEWWITLLGFLMGILGTILTLYQILGP